VSQEREGRLAVRKMYKLFIGGAFVRSESGRSDPLWDGRSFGANIARASRKDVRDAVTAAKAAQPRWWGMTAANRGLVLYRLAEMLESRRAEFVQRVADGTPCDADDAEREVDAAIDRTVWYAGWCDKYAALLSTRNPVGGPYFNFSTAEPMGIVGLFFPDRPSLLGIVSTLLPPLVAGNAIVAIASERDPRTAIVFAEAIATSDVPAGAVNILTGLRSELAPVVLRHLDVQVVGLEDGMLDPATLRGAAENVKRVHVWPRRSRAAWFSPSAQRLDEIAAYSEIKTIWHPAGI
jgi:acyl-CoA reductase-like NAD-dependent aldehyde dehydrogenase